jgi:GNAT superfamily N-acetyltransferase
LNDYAEAPMTVPEMPDYVAAMMKENGIPDDVAAAIYSRLAAEVDVENLLFDIELDSEISSYLDLQTLDFGEAAAARDDILAAAAADSPDDWTHRHYVVTSAIERFIALRDASFDGAPPEYAERLKAEAALLFPGRIEDQWDYVRDGARAWMSTVMTIQALSPQNLSDDQRTVFVRLVEEGEEVDNAALATNIDNARILIFGIVEGDVKGIAALKRPQASYREKIREKAGVEVGERHYAYELGYVVLMPEARGRKVSHRLVAEALAHADGRPIFATARADNAPMLAALAKAGFAAVGREYRGRKNQKIRLLVREV